jgi:competence protein ComEC
MLSHERTRNTLLIFVVFFAILSLVLWFLVFVRSERAPLEVTMLDVGQGDAFFIESPGGTQILIDGGRGTEVLRELSKVMPFWDRSLDIVIATHPDADHIGGLVGVLERFDVEHILETSVENDTATFRAYRERVTSEGATHIPPAQGTRIIVDGSAVLTIISREMSTASETNEASIIVRLDYGETSFLFTGDAVKRNERELLRFHRMLDTDVLKVGHHGSNTSTSAEFLSAVSPDIALISVGADNRYGHPHKEVLDRLIASGADIVRTDTEGTVRLVSDGTNIIRKPVGILGELFGVHVF